jgi:hypothetical protein
MELSAFDAQIIQVACGAVEVLIGIWPRLIIEGIYDEWRYIDDTEPIAVSAVFNFL